MTIFLDFDSDLEAAQAAIRLQQERPHAKVFYQPGDSASGRQACITIIE
jgi:hypothetical protein